MAKFNSITPEKGENPSHFAERLGVQYASTVSQSHKKEIGQFFTPIAIADLMASLSQKNKKTISIVDPGCGTAILSCSLIEYLTNNAALKAIDLVAYEIDKGVLPYLQLSLAYLKEWLKDRKISLTFEINTSDYILDNINLPLNGSLKGNKVVDLVISNPPYFKLSKDDERIKSPLKVVNGQTNIYSVFMSVSAHLLKEDGELIFIVPRSFTSGNYFKTFREYFFSIMQLDHIHLFVSRKDPFTKDSVLQETVIVKASKKSNIDPEHEVIVSSSHGISDIEHSSRRSYQQGDLIDLGSKEKILHFPTNAFEEQILRTFKSWSGNLNQYHIQISTGPVVAFRSLDFIYNQYENGTVFLAPLFWLHNVGKMVLTWPIVKPNKGQYIRILPTSQSTLIPNKNYILLRRFSTKDDKSRLIAAPYFCNAIDADYIGVENKVNYIYRPKGHLERNEVVGLCALLNSDLFDNYFRIFNGNVNVSATELREMPLPPLDAIKNIGDQIILSNNYSLENINDLISQYFELTEILATNE